MSSRIVILLLIQFVFAYSMGWSKSKIAWRGKCYKEKVAMNDCNVCHCKNRQYVCESRICSAVDVFGHFNDAIKDINVGMEGKGAWRSKETACNPGVEYRSGDLLCVCGEDGTWSNPTCRDTFRVLHTLDIIGEREPDNQKCTPTKLYLIGCNVCSCPSDGIIDSKLCTKHFCEDDSVLDTSIQKLDEENISEDHTHNISEDAMYVTCTPGHKYKLGCKTCVCLKNNRLHCNNKCTNSNIQSYCENVKPGHVFSRDCNLCYCDEEGYSYCTAKKCLSSKKTFSRNLVDDEAAITDVVEGPPVGPENCVDGKYYRVKCNTCMCYRNEGKKYFSCTLKHCGRTKELETIHNDCVENTLYEYNCLKCSCEVMDGTKMQVCEVNPDCRNGGYERSTKLELLHGYCEPLRIYKKDCNDCRCLSDARTLMCTSRICKKPEESITADIIPVGQVGKRCPKGAFYKIDCNFCFCLSNGNAICTTADCNNSGE